MKYADTYEFTSHFEPANPCAKSPVSVRAKIKASFRSLSAPRFDPTRLTKVEQREMGIMESEIDWHNALHGPFVK